AILHRGQIGFHHRTERLSNGPVESRRSVSKSFRRVKRRPRLQSTRRSRRWPPRAADGECGWGHLPAAGLRYPGQWAPTNRILSEGGRSMSAKFELAKSPNGQYHFHLKAANGEIILTSEMYNAKGSAEAGIESVKTNAPEDTRYERRASRSGEPFFVLHAA